MVVTDTLEGIIDNVLWYHYDVSGDVLYLRLLAKREIPTVGEETDDGFILLCDPNTDQPVGMTVVNWWKRFGTGPFPDSISEIHRLIEPWGRRIAA